MSDKETFETEDQIAEGAADTLKPGGAPGESKAQVLQTFTSLLSQLGKEDLTNLFNRTLEQIGHEADSIPAGAAASNKASISVKEDLDELFSEESEDFREKTSVIFEAALNTRAQLLETQLQEEFEEAIEQLEEEYAAKLEEEMGSLQEELEGAIDQYLNYVAEAWLKENALEADKGLKATIAEDFMVGLKNLFAEHYIEVPEDRVDVFAELRAELDEVRGRLEESLNRNIELEDLISEATREAVLDELSEGLVVTQSEKLRTLCEGVDYSDEDTFRRKVAIIKENCFKEKSKSASTGLITEELAGELHEEAPAYTTPQMAAYVNAAKPKF